jgi:hypothetical protein
MALGDSITAGLFAQPSNLEEQNQALAHGRDQKPFRQDGGKYSKIDHVQHSWQLLGGFEEYRGKSYAMGGDEDVITIPQVSGSRGCECGTAWLIHP